MFSAVVMDHVLNPRNAGPMPEATHVGVAGCPGDGPYVILHLLVEGGVVQKASYETYGCPAAIACSSLLCELLLGRRPCIVERLTDGDLESLLKGLPDGKRGIASLALCAARDAVLELFAAEQGDAIRKHNGEELVRP